MVIWTDVVFVLLLSYCVSSRITFSNLTLFSNLLCTGLFSSLHWLILKVVIYGKSPPLECGKRMHIKYSFNSMQILTTRLACLCKDCSFRDYVKFLLAFRMPLNGGHGFPLASLHLVEWLCMGNAHADLNTRLVFS